MKLYPHQLQALSAMENIKYFSVFDNPARRSGKSAANLAYIKFCLKQNLKLIIGTSNQQQTIDDLRKSFPTALFVLVPHGVEIKIRNRKELEI